MTLSYEAYILAVICSYAFISCRIFVYGFCFQAFMHIDPLVELSGFMYEKSALVGNAKQSPSTKPPKKLINNRNVHK